MSDTIARPPYDRELAVALESMTEELVSLTPELIAQARVPSLPIDDLLAARGVEHTERTIPGPTGAPEVTISVFRRTDHIAGGPGIFAIHGGGMVAGDRFHGIDVMLEWVELMDAVCVSVEYRLAPEHPDPAPVEDCYAGLVWTADHAEELGFEAHRLMVAGVSAGGGLSAGVTLLARDRGAPALAAQMLICPMIDDRNDTVSSRQFAGIGVWDRGSNETGWNALLGDRRHTADVSQYAAPTRATDLSGLPPAFIDVGSAEVFRDENVAYATAIWAAGGIAELHVWPGAFHASDQFVADAALSRTATATRTAWVRRTLGA